MTTPDRTLESLHASHCDHRLWSIDAIRACPVPGLLRAAYVMALEDAAKLLEAGHRDVPRGITNDIANDIRALAAEVKP